MSEKDELGDIKHNVARASSLFVDEIGRARASISVLEKVAKSDPSLSRKYENSLAKIWKELDLIMEEFHKIDSF